MRTVVIIGGDSDFMPVAQKIKAAGRTLIGIGTRRNTNKHWAKSRHDGDAVRQAELTQHLAR